MKSMSAPLTRGIVALLLAFVIWVFVSFTENPQQTVPMTNLPVVADGLPNTMTLVDPEGRPIPVPDDVINLSVSGPQDVLSRLTKANVQPFVRLNGLEPGIHQVPIQVRSIPTRTDLDFRSIQPAMLNLTIESIITATVPLTVTTSGQPPTSYEAGSPTASISNKVVKQVSIVGPSSQVHKVIGGHIELDLSSQTSSLNSRRKVIPVDANGREVEGITVTPELVDVKVTVVSSSGLKRVPIVYVIKNQPPAGVRPIVRLNPAFVTVIGSSQRLDDLDFIETEPIVLPEIAEPFSTTAKLRFPLGVTPIDAQTGASTVVAIDWQTITLQVQIQLPVVAINLEPNLDVHLSPSVVNLLVSGDPAMLQQSDLALVVDVAGKNAGTYHIQPSLNLPNGLTLVQPLPTIEVRLISTLPTPTVQPIAPTGVVPVEPTVEPTPIDPVEITPTIPISPTVTP